MANDLQEQLNTANAEIEKLHAFISSESRLSEQERSGYKVALDALDHMRLNTLSPGQNEDLQSFLSKVATIFPAS